jgi:4-amino-4-deoxy-L-arabinose transferase-like glycosyltransferase
VKERARSAWARIRRRPWEPLVRLAVLALAAWLRLRQLDLVEFKLDEATAVDLARRLLDGHLATVGLVSSTGALNPPLFVYLTAIPLAVQDDPLAATAFIGVLAVAAVALTYAVLRPRFGALTALTAAALFATAPRAVVYGRKIWAQDALPVFTVSLLWSLFCVLERRRSRASLAVPILLCLAFQLNFSALALVVPASAVLLYRAREVNWRAFAAGVAVTVLLLAPWLAHEARHGLDDVRILAREGHGGDASALGAGSIKAIVETQRLIGGTGWGYLTGASQALFEADAGWLWTVGRLASLLAIALLALGFGTSALRLARTAALRGRWPFVELDADAARRALLLMWLVGIWVSYAGSATDRIYPHYLIVSYPISFAVQAVGVSDLVAAARGGLHRVATAVTIGVLAAMVTGFVAFTLSFHRFLDVRGGTAGDYGITYTHKAALARVVRDQGLRIGDEQTLDFLVTGELDAPSGTRSPVTVRDRLDDPTPLPCTHELRSFGPLTACLPAVRRPTTATPSRARPRRRRALPAEARRSALPRRRCARRSRRTARR